MTSPNIQDTDGDTLKDGEEIIIRKEYIPLSELENELISKWNGTVCESYVRELIEFQKKQLEDRRAEWMKKMLKK